MQPVCQSCLKDKKEEEKNLKGFGPQIIDVLLNLPKIPSRKNLVHSPSKSTLLVWWLLVFYKSHRLFDQHTRPDSQLPGGGGVRSVIVPNNSVKDAEKITPSFLNITRVSSSRIWVYWVWKLIFKCLSNLRITNNFSLRWSQIPHFLGFHFISCKTNMKKLSPFSPITGLPCSLSRMYWFISAKRLLKLRAMRT